MALQHSFSSPAMTHLRCSAIHTVVTPVLWIGLGLFASTLIAQPALAQVSTALESETLEIETSEANTNSIDASPNRRLPSHGQADPSQFRFPGEPLEPQHYASSTLLFVNPYTGNNEVGNGSQQSPLKTLTHALDVAASGTVIILAPGIYDATNGEQFPISLKSGVTVQGDPGNLGEGILIQGGGRFLSPTFAGQDVTLLGANEAVLMGVTVTNPNGRGYGLWIESTSPTVTRNTFSQNVHDGISITGESQPTIQGNHFYRNGANGVTVYGTSQPNIQGNVFEATGFGINVGQNAAPRLVDNRIWNNRSGIVIQGEAQPFLRRNVVEFNEQDGLVAIAQSRPNLGLENDPGQNRFSDNGQSDINAEVATHPIIAIGNTLDLSRVIGIVRTTMPPTRIASLPSPEPTAASPSPLSVLESYQDENRAVEESIIEEEVIVEEIIAEEKPEDASSDRSILRILASVPPSPSPTLRSTTREPQLTLEGIPSSPAARISEPDALDINNSDQAGDNTGRETVGSSDLEPGGAIDIPITLLGEASNSAASDVPLSTTAVSRRTLPQEPAPRRLNSPLTDSVALSIERPDANPLETIPSIAIAPAPFSSRPRITQSSPPENLLPVPGTSVPEGHLGSLSTLPAQQNSFNTTLLSTLPFTPTSTQQQALQYRVLAEVDTYEARVLINTIVPDAFLTQVNGQTMMQIGAYSQLENANDIAYQLVEQGLKVEVQRID